MSIPKACCTLPPVESSYTPKGTECTLGDLTLYETGDTTSDCVLICAYDIFGFHPVTKQFCDKLGYKNFRVVMPDFFRGNPLTAEMFATLDRPGIMAFVQENGSWEKTVKADVLQVLEKYKKLGVKSFGMFGFCWGSIMSVKAIQELSSDVKAAVLIHPSMVGEKDAETAQSPVLSLPTKDDADMVPFNNIIKGKFGAEGSGHHRFEDMHHGFAAARGNLDDELNRKRVDEALSLTFDFFNRHVK